MAKERFSVWRGAILNFKNYIWPRDCNLPNILLCTKFDQNLDFDDDAEFPSGSTLSTWHALKIAMNE